MVSATRSVRAVIDLLLLLVHVVVCVGPFVGIGLRIEIVNLIVLDLQVLLSHVFGILLLFSKRIVDCWALCSGV
jgi:Mn2+/Fe2+ NRAMP family transporter